ncbi:mechanosensitive ion channel family protein [Candidatus Micrarchaeota archaeon]|nr:mechanosensitive ion channel family protein [Candidatus Micrarchaeota archaeon]MBU1939786.1 mechanosensitive ion channel family protein [Candidatus Micrarchaeota archaeon]
MFENLTSMLPGFLSGVYFGSSLIDYALFFITLVISGIVGKVLYYIIKVYGKRLAAKTKSDFDDILLEIIQEPVVFLLIILGIATGFEMFLRPGIGSVAGIGDTVYNIIGTLVIMVVAWFAVRLVDAIIVHFVTPLTKHTKSKLDDQLIPILSRLSKACIIIMAGIIVLSNFGYDVTALIAGLGIGGLAIAFAAKDTLANIFGGFAIFASKPFSVGDMIEFGDVLGTVKEVGLRTTRLKNLDDRMVTLPNSKISDAIVTNISSSPTRKIRMHIGITYDTPVTKMRLAEKLLAEIINKTAGCRKKPDTYFTDFKDFYLDLFLIYHIEDKENWMRIKHDVNYKIKEAFDKNKIDFAFPSQTVYLKK